MRLKPDFLIILYHRCPVGNKWNSLEIFKKIKDFDLLQRPCMHLCAVPFMMAKLLFEFRKQAVVASASVGVEGRAFSPFHLPEDANLISVRMAWHSIYIYSLPPPSDIGFQISGFRCAADHALVQCEGPIHLADPVLDGIPLIRHTRSQRQTPAHLRRCW